MTLRYHEARGVIAAGAGIWDNGGMAETATAERIAAEPKVDLALVEKGMALLVAHDRVAEPAVRKAGAFVFEEYFGGDEKLVRSRNPVKGLSYGALAERAENETSWDAVKLRRAVAAVIVARALKASVVSEIAPTFLWLMYPIEDPETRRALAEKIVNGELYGDAAREAIARAIEKERGRPPAVRRPSVAVAISGLWRAYEKAKSRQTFSLSNLRRLDEKEAKKDAGDARRLAAALVALADNIEKSIG